MKNRSKRYLVMLLTVLMAFSTFGFTAFALDDAKADEGVAAETGLDLAVEDQDEPEAEAECFFPTVAPVLASDLTYNGSDQELVVDAKGIMYFAVTDKYVNPACVSGFSKDLPTGLDAGTYYVYYKDPCTCAHVYAGCVVIKQAPITLEWGETSFVYDGEEKVVTASLVGVLEKDADQVEVVYFDEEGYAHKAVDAGEYTACVIGISGARAFNYLLVDAEGKPICENNKAEQPWVIAKASLTITVNDNTIYYRDMPSDKGFTFTGLVNKDKDEAGQPVLGVFIDPETGNAVTTDEFVGIINVYEKNGKPGKYPLAANHANSYVAKNYEVEFVDGTLTVLDKVTAIVAKAEKRGAKSVTLAWNSITGAKAYDVYYARCNHDGKTIKLKKIATVTGLKYTKKGLKKGNCYKMYVIAKDANGNKISKSKCAHFIAGEYNKTHTNVKSITVKANTVSLAKGATSKISATQKKVKKSKKYLRENHAVLLRYRSENTEVATVSADGTIKAVGRGWCRVYVQSVDGLWQKIEVTVK